VFICCAVSHIFFFFVFSFQSSSEQWLMASVQGRELQKPGSTSTPSCPSSSPRVRENDFLSLWLPWINPLNMQCYLYAAVHRPTPTEVGQQSIVHEIEAHLARSMISSLHLHLHPLSWVRISKILSIKGGRPESYFLKPRLR
jgi:hypothetical protein